MVCWLIQQWLKQTSLLKNPRLSSDCLLSRHYARSSLVTLSAIILLSLDQLQYMEEKGGKAQSKLSLFTDLWATLSQVGCQPHIIIYLAASQTNLTNNIIK